MFYIIKVELFPILFNISIQDNNAIKLLLYQFVKVSILFCNSIRQSFLFTMIFSKSCLLEERTIQNNVLTFLMRPQFINRKKDLNI